MSAGPLVKSASRAGRWIHTLRKAFGEQLLLPLLFLLLQPILPLQPAFSRVVFDIFVYMFFFDLVEVLRDAADVAGLALFRCVVTRRHIAERRPRCEKSEEIRRELVRHGGFLLYKRVRERDWKRIGPFKER